MRAGRNRNARAGFTLLEVLVAIALLSLAFSIVWSSFSAVMNAWTRGTKMMDRLHRGDFILDQIALSLRSAAFFQTRPEKYGFWLEDHGSGSDARDRLSWVSSGAALIPPDSPLANGLHRVSVTIDDAPDGQNSVAVRAWPHLAETEADDVDPWFLASAARGLNCEVYVKDDPDMSGDWESEWEDTNSLPRLVRLALYMDPVEEYGAPVMLERLIEIPVAPPLGEAVTPPPEGGGEKAPVAGGAAGGEKPTPAEGERPTVEVDR